MIFERVSLIVSVTNLTAVYYFKIFVRAKMQEEIIPFDEIVKRYALFIRRRFIPYRAFPVAPVSRVDDRIVVVRILGIDVSDD